jgi:septal ring factor EnvC (AmiA/AmiB activator)
MRSALVFFLIFTFVLTGAEIFVSGTPAFAQTVEQLQAQIAERNKRLGEIEKEIAQFESSLKEVGAERSTLEKSIKGLELERRKINADIEYTQNLISNTDLEISKLSIEISQTLRDINLNRSAIGEVIRSIQMSDDDSFIEILLNNNNVSEFWGALDDLDSVRGSMEEQVKELSGLQTSLETKRFQASNDIAITESAQTSHDISRGSADSRRTHERARVVRRALPAPRSASWRHRARFPMSP